MTRYQFWLSFRYGQAMKHEVYPAAPVVLVALEVRHPPTDPLTRHDRHQLKSELGKYTPILKSATSWGFQMSLGPGATAPQSLNQEFPKYFDRSSTAAVSYQAEAIIIETSQYAGWVALMELATLAFNARDRVAPVDGVSRVGLRFINEIRLPEPVEDWSLWVSQALLQPPIDNLIEMPLNQWQGTAVYGEHPGRALALRFGPNEGSTIIQPNPELRARYRGPLGEFFLIDLDSFIVPKDGTPAYELEELITTCNDLHTPIKGLFEGLVTPKLRDEVFRNDHGNQPA